jgi:uncharacterized membrane protein YtjA (UPF0391 family)
LHSDPWAAAAGIAKFLSFIFVAVFLVLLVLGLLGAGTAATFS